MTETALDKTFDPAAIEAKWYAHWEENGLFRPERPNAQPFTIVNPPPNVTGSLHIGHALDNTLQDVVIRYERLRGKDALWVVGTDHAGIATQMVVERQMEARQDKRSNYTREQFIDKVWEWKAESGGTITGQLRRLGCSMDWSREQFTMDPHFTRAVVKVFVDLYNQGLLYRDKRLVNWDPKLKTAISDLEVETREIKGHFWHFRYPLADGVKLDSGADHIVVATTRPETMLADMAVAVNPEDPRYASVIGKHILLPITGRRIAIVADEHADPELGSGAVKITPGHDFNDFEVGKRAGIKPSEMLNMFDAEAFVVQTADGLIPAEFVGLERFAARAAVVERLKAEDRLVPHIDKDGAEHDAEPRVIQTPYGDRGGVVIEPWLTDQWYVNAAELAKAPIEAVRSGAIEIVPKSWEKTFFNWMENIQPWCVSRQLWWGHRIPAWYDEAGDVFVAETEEEAQALAGSRQLTRDEDVLDTWFSSALWPFATLGWPEVPSPLQGRGRSAAGAEGVGDVATPGQLDSPHSPTLSPEGERESLLSRHYPNVHPRRRIAAGAARSVCLRLVVPGSGKLGAAVDPAHAGPPTGSTGPQDHRAPLDALGCPCLLPIGHVDPRHPGQTQQTDGGLNPRLVLEGELMVLEHPQIAGLVCAREADGTEESGGSVRHHRAVATKPIKEGIPQRISRPAPWFVVDIVSIEIHPVATELLKRIGVDPYPLRVGAHHREGRGKVRQVRKAIGVVATGPEEDEVPALQCLGNVAKDHLALRPTHCAASCSRPASRSSSSTISVMSLAISTAVLTDTLLIWRRSLSNHVGGVTP